MVSQKDKIIWSNVETLLRDKRWNLADLAKAMQVTPQAINSLKTSGIGIRSIKKLSAALNVEEIDLYKIDAPIRRPRMIPVISWVHAGLFTESADLWPPGVSGEGDPVQSIKVVGPNAFGLRVEGDSMWPRVFPGDIVIVDPAIKCDNGAMCVVMLRGEVSLKLFYEDDNEIRLVPMNEKYGNYILYSLLLVYF